MHRHVLPGRDECLLNYPHKHDMEARDLIVTGMKTVIYGQLEGVSLEGKYQYSNRDYSSSGRPDDIIWTLSCRKGMKKRDTAGRVGLEEEEQVAIEDQFRETEEFHSHLKLTGALGC